jgi:hypothetical protein
VLLTAEIMANVSIWNMYRRTLSEVAFLPLLMWSVNLSNDVLAPERSKRGVRLAALCACLLLLIATREIGLIAAVAVALNAAIARRAIVKNRLLASTGAVAGLLGVALLLRRERLAAIANAMQAAFDTPSTAISTISEMARRRVIEINQVTIPGMFNAYSDPPAWVDANLFAGAIVVASVGLGWSRLIRNRSDTFLILGPLYVAVLIFWPYDGSTRYVLPLLPLIAACGWTALSDLGERRRALIALALVAHLVVTAGYWLLIDLPRVRQCHAAWAELDQIARVVGKDPRVSEGDQREVVVSAVAACVQLGLQVALDRPVRSRADDRRPAKEIGWLLIPHGHPAVPGFTKTVHDGAYELWSRTPLPAS